MRVPYYTRLKKALFEPLVDILLIFKAMCSMVVFNTLGRYSALQTAIQCSQHPT